MPKVVLKEGNMRIWNRHTGDWTKACGLCVSVIKLIPKHQIFEIEFLAQAGFTQQSCLYLPSEPTMHAPSKLKSYNLYRGNRPVFSQVFPVSCLPHSKCVMNIKYVYLPS